MQSSESYNRWARGSYPVSGLPWKSTTAAAATTHHQQQQHSRNRAWTGYNEYGQVQDANLIQYNLRDIKRQYPVSIMTVGGDNVPFSDAVTQQILSTLAQCCDVPEDGLRQIEQTLGTRDAILYINQKWRNPNLWFSDYGNFADIIQDTPLYQFQVGSSTGSSPPQTPVGQVFNGFNQPQTVVGQLGPMQLKSGSRFGLNGDNGNAVHPPGMIAQQDDTMIQITSDQIENLATKGFDYNNNNDRNSSVIIYNNPVPLSKLGSLGRDPTSLVNPQLQQQQQHHSEIIQARQLPFTIEKSLSLGTIQGRVYSISLDLTPIQRGWEGEYQNRLPLNYEDGKASVRKIKSVFGSNNNNNLNGLDGEGNVVEFYSVLKQSPIFDVADWLLVKFTGYLSEWTQRLVNLIQVNPLVPPPLEELYRTERIVNALARSTQDVYSSQKYILPHTAQAWRMNNMNQNLEYIKSILNPYSAQGQQFQSEEPLLNNVSRAQVFEITQQLTEVVGDIDNLIVQLQQSMQDYFMSPTLNAYMDVLGYFLGSKLVEMGLSTFFPLMYGSFMAIDDQYFKGSEAENYLGVNLSYGFPTECLMMETMDGDIADLFPPGNALPNTPSWFLTRSGGLQIERLASCLFQCLAGWSQMQLYFGMIQNDEHLGNIMYLDSNSEAALNRGSALINSDEDIVYSTQDEECIYYSLRKSSGEVIYYRIPTFGKIFKQIDFGRCSFQLNHEGGILPDNNCGFHKTGGAAAAAAIGFNPQTTTLYGSSVTTYISDDWSEDGSGPNSINPRNWQNDVVYFMGRVVQQSDIMEKLRALHATLEQQIPVTTDPEVRDRAQHHYALTGNILVMLDYLFTLRNSPSGYDSLWDIYENCLDPLDPNAQHRCFLDVFFFGPSSGKYETLGYRPRDLVQLFSGWEIPANLVPSDATVYHI